MLAAFGVTTSKFSGLEITALKISLDATVPSLYALITLDDDIELKDEPYRPSRFGDETDPCFLDHFMFSLQWAPGSVDLRVSATISLQPGLALDGMIYYSSAGTWTLSGALDVRQTLINLSQAGIAADATATALTLEQLLQATGLSMQGAFLDDVSIAQLGISATIVEDGQNTYTVDGEVEAQWTIAAVPFATDVTFDLTFAGSSSGTVSATLDFDGFPIDVSYAFNDDPHNASSQIDVKVPDLDLEGTYDVSGTSTTITLSFIKGSQLSFNEVLAKLVDLVTGNSYTTLPAPWDIFDFNLASLDPMVTVTCTTTNGVTTKTISFSITCPPNTGIPGATVQSLVLTYGTPGSNPATKSGFHLEINGDFSLFKMTSPLSMDPTNPATAPTVPGQGSALVQVLLAAAGQGVALTGAPTTVNEATALIQAMLTGQPSGTQLPATLPVFSADAGWLIGLDLLIEQQAQVKLAFADPSFYGVEITVLPKPLSGGGSKFIGALAGFDAQILYRKISDTLGVYEGSVTLPTSAKQIDIGMFQLQLPSISGQIYTDGEFEIDVGFPQNGDFSQSFSIVAGEYEGAGGVLFGRLSQQTGANLPAVIVRSGQPVGAFGTATVIGIGLQVGVNYGYTSGPLTADMQVTLSGIFQGTFAEYTQFSSGAVGEYYSVKASVTVAGKVVGSVNFVIVSASLLVAVSLTVAALAVAGQPTPVAIDADLEVDLTVTIGAGWLSYSHTFHFETSLAYNAVVGSASTQLWQIAGPGATEAVEAPKPAEAVKLIGVFEPLPDFSVEAPVYLLPTLTRNTVAGTPSWCYALAFGIPNDAFLQVSKAVFAWFVQAAKLVVQPGREPYESLTLTRLELDLLVEALHLDAKADIGIPSQDAIRRFFAKNLVLNLGTCPTQTVDVATFPMLPGGKIILEMAGPQSIPAPVSGDTAAAVLHDYLVLTALCVADMIKASWPSDAQQKRYSLADLFVGLIGSENQISGMVSRFMLHGSTKDGQPLYVATGQEIPFTPLASGSLALVFEYPSPELYGLNPSWGTIVLSSADTPAFVNSCDAISDFTTTPYPGSTVTYGLLPFVTAVPQQFPLPVGADILDPEDEAETGGAVRPLPQSLIDLLGTSSGDAFEIVDTSGNIVPAGSYDWCSTVSVQLRTHPAVQSDVEVPIYSLVGVRAADVDRLTALYEAVVSGAAPSSMELLLPSAAEGELQPVAVASPQVFIYQNNLSTQNDPPGGPRFEVGDESDPVAAFLARLLASALTNRGGFFLYVKSGTGGSSNPGELIEATLVVHLAQGAESGLPSYVSAIRTNDPDIDSVAVLYAQSATVTAELPAMRLGTVGLQLINAPSSLPPVKYQPSLDALFHLVGFQPVVRNADGRVIADYTADPIPTSPDTSNGQPTTEWIYNRTLDLFVLSDDRTLQLYQQPKKALVPPLPVEILDRRADPYQFVGGSIALAACWMDMFGNKLGAVGQSDDPTVIPWSDPLGGFASWPGLTIGYLVDRDLLGIGRRVLRFKMAWHPPQHDMSISERTVYALKYARLYHQLSRVSVVAVPSFTVAPVDQVDQLIGHTPIAEALRRRIAVILDAFALGSRITVPLEDLVLRLPAEDNGYTRDILKPLSVRMQFTLDAWIPLPADVSAGAFDAATPVVPYHRGGNDGDASTFHDFARRFEDTLSSLDFKVMTGDSGGTGSPNFWTLRYGASGLQLTVAPSDNFIGYAPRPLATQLIARDGIPVDDLNQQILTMTGGDNRFVLPGPTISIAAFDVDAAMADYLAALDGFLGPDTGVPATLVPVSSPTAATAADVCLGAKQDLALGLSTTVSSLDAQNAHVDPAAAMAYQQAMLKTASSFYGVDAVATMKVSAAFGEGVPPESFAIFGRAMATADHPLPGGVSFSPMNCTLASVGDGDFSGTFAIGVCVTQKGLSAELSLPGAFRFEAIQTRIRTVPIDTSGGGRLNAGESLYTTGVWLHFLLPPPLAELDLKKEAVALPLRQCPTAPILVDQGYAPEASQSPMQPSDLQAAKKWSFDVGYRHYAAAQDTLQLKYVVNQNGAAPGPLADSADLAAALALFKALQPSIQPLLTTDLADSFSPSDDARQAAIAFAAVSQTIAGVCAAQVTRAPRYSIGDLGQTFNFEITEEASSIDDPLTSPWRVVVRSPDGSGTSSDVQVAIAGYDAVTVEGTDDAAVYTYKSQSDGTMLTAPRAAQIPDRTASLVGVLDVIGAQSGQAYLTIGRNIYESVYPDLVSFPAAFQYQTPEVTFRGPFYPVLGVSEEIRWNGGGSTLSIVLADMLGAVVASGYVPAAGTVDVQIRVDLGVPLQSSTAFELPFARSPLILQLAQSLLINAGAGDTAVTALAGNLATQIIELVASDTLWQIGRLYISIEVFSTLAEGNGIPIFTLDGLYIPMSSIGSTASGRPRR